MRIGLTVFLACGLAAPLGAQLADGIAAIVNDSVITYEEVMALSARAIELYERQYGRNSAVFRQKVAEATHAGLTELIERKLILDDFKQAGYNLPESVIEDHIREQIRERYDDRVRLIQTLQAQGKTYEAFKQEVRERFIEAAMRSKNVSSEIIISPTKIENYFQLNQDKFQLGDQIKLRMIVLDKSKHGPDTGKLAQEIVVKLEEGAAFNEMATLYSDGSQAAQGGDWGWVEKSVLREDLREAAFSQKAGQRSGVIDRPDGSFVMLVEETRPAHVKPLAEVRDEIEKALVAQERARLQKKWIDRLRNKSFIRSFPEP
jgi:peptidyl-prolyl cis-trans isomerase SurA